MIPYADAVELTYQSRWAGTKDGDRSRSRALACNTHLDQGEPFSVPQASLLKDRLKASGLGPASVNRHLSAYFAVWRTLVQRGLLQHGPPSGLLNKEPRGRVRVVTRYELDNLLEELDPAYRPLVEFLNATGCRVSEALELTDDRIFTDLRACTFVDTKNGDDRLIPLEVNAQAALIASGMSCPRLKSDPPRPFANCTQSGLNHAWASARSRLSLDAVDEFVPHALRHTYASRLIAAGVPLPVVARLLGHRSIRTTMRYVHVSLQDSLTALQRAGIM